MDALLLAAGFGTRLRPLTEQIAKPLLPIYGVPLLELHLARLLSHGGPSPISRITVNGHHLAEQIRSHLDLHPTRERIVFSHEPEILGTGGALTHAAQSLTSDPFLVLNCDVLFDPPIEEAIAFHKRHDFTATMVLVHSQVRPNVQIEGNRVTAILRERQTPDAFTFTGFHVASAQVLDMIPNGLFHDIRDTYETLLPEGKLGAFVWRGETKLPFLDIGTPEAYLQAHRVCSGGSRDSFRISPAESKITYAEGYGFADRTATLGMGCRIEESVVLSDARIAAGARIVRSIVGPGASVTGEVSDKLVTTIGERKIRG